jgi:hypothetical protein
MARSLLRPAVLGTEAGAVLVAAVVVAFTLAGDLGDDDEEGPPAFV